MKVLASAVLLLVLTGPAPGAAATFEITVSNGPHDRRDLPVCVPLDVPADLAEAAAHVLGGANNRLPAQLTGPGLLAETPAPAGKARRELHFVLPRLEAGEKVTLRAVLSTEAKGEATGFSWHEEPAEYAELRLKGRPVLRYMHQALDDSSKERREQTYKVYHHLFDPSGERLVTKGPGGKFTHHRGLFYGFNKVTYGGGKQVDVWHCTGDAHQAHERVLSREAGPVLGRHRVLIAWRGKGKEVFAREERELTVYRRPGGHLVEFASRVRSTGGPVKVDGDPQHAGFHFRADDEVASRTARQTYYLRPDGKGEPGETRNWPGDRRHVNLPWNAMSFVLGGRRYTAVYLDRPDNPKEARFSERDYGRFGSYFATQFTEQKPLTVRYRLWLQDGEVTGEEAAALRADFVEPPETSAVPGR